MMNLISTMNQSSQGRDKAQKITDLMTSDDDDDEPFVKERKNDAGHLGCTNIERLMVIQG